MKMPLAIVAALLAPLLSGVTPVTPATDLRVFRAAPVGARLAALRHEPLSVRRLRTGEWAVLIHAPEQSAISNWDDETRLVLYRPGTTDFERTQFVSKAGQAVPGRTDNLEVRDLDGDGVEELLIRGRPHGPVGKSTVMIFRRGQPDDRFYLIFRRRHLGCDVAVLASGIRLRYQAAEGQTREEMFRMVGHGLVGAEKSHRPIKWD